MRRMLCFGGPRDGEAMDCEQVPAGYRDFAGMLVVWEKLNVAAMPLWQQQHSTGDES